MEIEIKSAECMDWMVNERWGILVNKLDKFINVEQPFPDHIIISVENSLWKDHVPNIYVLPAIMEIIAKKVADLSINGFIEKEEVKKKTKEIEKELNIMVDVIQGFVEQLKKKND